MAVTQWFIVGTKELLAEIIQEVELAGEPPYLLVNVGEGAVIFDFQSMKQILESYNKAMFEIIKGKQLDIVSAIDLELNELARETDTHAA